jgi:hypothetical protein
MDFLRRNGRFIVPMPWLLLAGLDVWRALRDGDSFLYLHAFEFSGVAVLSYWGYSRIHAIRQQEKK